MAYQIAYYEILGKPLILYMGIITYATFVFAALIPILNQKKVWNIPFVWHLQVAKIALVLGTLHGLMGILSYF